MFKRVLFLTLLGMCCGQSDTTAEELTNLLQSVFGKPSTTTTSDPSEETWECTTAKLMEGKCFMANYCKSGNTEANVNYKGKCDEGMICCPIDDVSLMPLETEGEIVKEEKKRTGCGWRNNPTESIRIVSDGRTEFGEFPWIVAVLEMRQIGEKRYASVYVGAGSLIHPRVVMITAHSIPANVTGLRVRAGEWDSATTDEIYPHQERNVESMIVHERYNTVRVNLKFDIALLVLKKPVDFAPNVNTICLPVDDQPPPPNTRCFSSGWGKDKFDKQGQYQAIPKKVELPVLDHAECQKSLRNSRLGQFFELHSSFLCAGGEVGKDTCTGDGGSPLMCPIPNTTDRYMASGMVAWGLGCGDQYPGVYANVAFLRKWVDDKMTELGYGTESYTYSV